MALTRERILDSALRYVDGNGLAALSMHKLGAELGVRAMTLYYYVDNKDDILDGLVDLMWSEIDPTGIDRGSWQRASRALAGGLRDLVHRHPNAAPLLMHRRVASAPQLRVYGAYLTSLQRAGFGRAKARDILRILVAYGFGYAQTELTAMAPLPGDTEPGRGLSDLPDDLRDVALEVCRGTDTAAHFRFGLDLMLAGLKTDG